MLKIVHIIDCLQVGGKERQLIELVKGLSTSENVKVLVIVLCKNNYYKGLDNLDIEVLLLDRKTKNDPLMFIRLFRIFKSFKPQIVHSWNLMCSVFVVPACKILNIPLVNGVIRNAPAELEKYNKEWLKIKLTFPFSKIILANSKAGLKSFNVDEKKGRYIYNGFDENRVLGLTDSNIIRTRFSIKSEYIVGMVARFHELKDFKTYILAAQSIIKQRDDITFLAIGAGPTLKECEAMVQDYEKTNIRFLGDQENVESLINIFDIGVLCTYTEGISNSIMEYMACSKPTIANAGGGTGELVINGKTGFLTTTGDIVDLIDKILYLIDNKNIAQEMGNLARERLASKFSLKNMTDLHLELYQKLV